MAPQDESIPVPQWALRQDLVKDKAHAAFMAGAALNSLDRIVRSQSVWAGAWRQRLAIKCGVAACRLAGRSEDELALRDVWALRPNALKGGETGAIGTLGPGGSLYAAWRCLAAGEAAADAVALEHIADLLGLAHNGQLNALPGQLDDIASAGLGAPFAAAAAAARTVALAPDAEPLAWWLADFVLAQTMSWPRPIPLFMGQAFSTAFRTDAGRRTRLKPGDSGFELALCLALTDGATQACRLAAEIGRRATRLKEVTPQLRAKGACDAIRQLLDDDAVPGTLATSRLSRFASRRLFQRLEDLGAVQELSGRTTFKLFGL
ncbi:DUF1403 family protein [Manganibacter manganicus]|uniref:DUF1403 family protein n=1 Tax=Manganibacter manganicus TaxID=1873176 RepID=A0A1V8RMI3_9HYPH|nr:DUF1403 family protein [Pseudaminobacter manganicus]OQM74354.1 hypothetical protein BFN67_05815 [Pseudaminobacter manganicus]